ncbi:uncharacterized protein LOC126812157 [Patella vulgata]|uniref:uncharacterized protein LOC126812157 n=1 Tax=Patella vulgata TaxID=6465 RepID=UPI0021809625|nr:uncharacterized protein LOC126812157 [Patella vulgata]
MWCYVTVVLVLVITSIPAQQQDYLPTVWNFNQYPDPATDYLKCGRRMKSSVCDPNGIITKSKADEIDRVIDGVRNDTRCMCYDCVQAKRGYIIRVAILPQMQKILNMTGNNPEGKLKDAQLFAYLLSQRWNLVGTCNETILILYARNDNIIYTLTRQHARLRLRDSAIIQVSMNTRHYFNKNATIADGIIQTILGYKTILRGEEYVPHFAEIKDDDSHGTLMTPTWCLLFISLFFIVSV